MNFRAGIDVYIEARRSEGTPFLKGAQILCSLERQVGDIQMERIRVNDVAAFLNGPLTSPVSWYKKYCSLRGFFHYWKARHAILALPLPPARRSPVQTFVPYVYSRTEIRRLLRAAGIVQRQFNCVIEPRTFRTLLLFLYGTGAMIGEAVGLRQSDVDLRRRRINIASNHINGSRVIPIGSDLFDILAGYHRTHHKKTAVCDPPFFVTRDGAQIKTDTANQTFHRVRKEAGIARHDGSRYQPRMYDLRHTFAVHRLTAWFKHGADMNRMIPALSAYMGQHELGAAERYLRMTPERFRKQLNKLSPQRGRKRWRDDAALMRFLDSL
jgi:integrase